MAIPKHLRPRKEPQQERSRALVDAVLEATARILVDRGFEAMTLQDVGELAGVSPGSLYQYFPHRESLVTALLVRQSEREAAFLAEHLASVAPTSVEAVIEAGIRGVLAFRGQDPALQQALLDVLPNVDSHALLEALRERGREVAQQLRAILALVYSPASDGPSLDELVFIVGNATHSLTHEGLIVRPASFDETRLGTEITRLVLGYVHACRGLGK
ncbi:MAG: TetR/AcrR family transcriptional regulator [Sandaracinus sp.]|nr:TetR/AcrR family transcriptional regulator [Sandaracinus sp.]